MLPLPVVSPQDATNIFNTVADKGLWGLILVFVAVQVVGAYMIVRMFKQMIDEEKATNRHFADAMAKIAEAENRRTKADNLRTELEYMKIATRTDIHLDLKAAATDAIKRTKEEIENSGVDL